MASTFDSFFASAGFPVLLQQFGESIEYLPYSGGSRPITAIVDRDPPAVLDAAGNVVKPRCLIRVYNSCLTGVASNEVDTGKDEFEFPLKIGDVLPTTFSVMQMLSQDSGVTQLALV